MALFEWDALFVGSYSEQFSSTLNGLGYLLHDGGYMGDVLCTCIGVSACLSVCLFRDQNRYGSVGVCTVHVEFQ